MHAPLDRRAFLQAAGGLGLLALAPPQRVVQLLAQAAADARRRGRFLSAHELDTLRAVTARLLPGAPEAPGPSALETRAAEAIDLLLGAFAVHPPLIHAGGPFSDRAGADHDDFAHFVPLDRQAELAWLIRLEGTRGRPERLFAGPVVGLQEIYRGGLARLDARARARAGRGFATAPKSLQDALLADARDRVVARFASTALANTLEATLGPPEYGGNRGLAGWHASGWEGDRQPRGYAAARVTLPDPQQAGAASADRRLDPALARRALAEIAPRLAGARGARTRP
jgi:hypothetical protein